LKTRTPPAAPQAVSIDLGINQPARLANLRAQKAGRTEEDAERIRLNGIAHGVLVEAEYIELCSLTGGPSRQLELGEYVKVLGVQRWPKKGARPLRPLPAASDHSSGVTVALDARLPLGVRSLAIWLYLLRHAGRNDGGQRRCVRVTYRQIGEAVGLTGRQVEKAIPRLVALGTVEVREPGRPARPGQPAQVPLYYVAWPSPMNLDTWRARGSGTNVGGASGTNVVGPSVTT
jgi:hypothetical protein